MSTKTPNLDKWLLDRHFEIPGVIVSPAATSLRVAVAEDIRLACKKAWLEGVFHGVKKLTGEDYENNPYSAKEQA